MKLQDKELLCATAVPLCRLESDTGMQSDVINKSVTYVFYGDWEPHFVWKDGLAADVIHLSRQDALNAFKVTADQDYLIISEQYVWISKDRLVVTGNRTTKFKSYPPLPETLLLSDQPAGVSEIQKTGMQGLFTCYERHVEGTDSVVRVEKVAQAQHNSVYEISLDYGENITDCLISIKYAGDSLRIYMEDEKIEDHFYTGQEVELSMRYFNFPRRLTVQVEALYQDTPVFLEQWPQMTEGKACMLYDVTARDEFR